MKTMLNYSRILTHLQYLDIRSRLKRLDQIARCMDIAINWASIVGEVTVCIGIESKLECISFKLYGKNHVHGMNKINFATLTVPWNFFLKRNWGSLKKSNYQQTKNTYKEARRYTR